MKKHWWIQQLEEQDEWLKKSESEEALKWFIKQNKITKKIKDEEQKLIKAWEPIKKEKLNKINELDKNIRELEFKIINLKKQQKIEKQKLTKIEEEINLCIAKIINGDIGKTLSQEAKKLLNGTHIHTIKEANLLLNVKKLHMDGINSQTKKSNKEQLTLVTN